jgi:molybdopterin-guanine dinucleotide biosynthesis protein A
MGAGVALACARSGEWRHPVVALWPLELREDLRKALVEEGLRKIEVWTARHGVAIADWPDKPFDPFFNVNTPEDAERATRNRGAKETSGVANYAQSSKQLRGIYRGLCRKKP